MKRSRRTYNYHPYIDDWMRKVEQRLVPSCNEQKLLMPFIRKVLDDPDTEIRKKVIDDGVDMLHKYFPFEMHDYQLFRFAIFYGLFQKGTDFPIFDENFNMWGRGTGKNGTASMDSVYLVSEHNGVKKYDVDFVANSEKQAKTSFEEVYGVIGDDPKLQRLFNRTKEQILYKNTNSKIGFLTANANTKDGGRQGAIVFDEVHQYENYEIISVLIGGLGKVDKPRIVYLTTDGTVREAVIDDLKEKSMRVLTGEEDHNGFFPFIFKMDNLQEVGKPELFSKAIPRIVHDETLKRQVMKEYNMMEMNNELKEKFITKRMNLAYVSKEKTVADWEDIKATANHEWPEELETKECIGSVDYAELRDFASVGLHWKHKGKHYFKQHTFIHEDSLKLTQYNVNIQEAVDEGFATIVKGYPIIPTEMIAKWFVEQGNKHYISKVYSDRFKYVALKSAFENIGLELVAIPNGAITHNQLAPIITRMFSERTLVWEDDKLMRWFTWNVKVETDKKENKTYTKIEPIKRKTDGFFCFLHGLVGTELKGELEEMENVTFYDISTF